MAELSLDDIIAKPISECTQEEQTELAKERYKCSKSFVYFLKYCKLVEAPTRDNPGGVIPFQIWEHTAKIIIALTTKLLISILKSRQIGASWIIACYVLWCALFHQGDTTLLFSKGELEAAELLGKCKRIYKFLPEFMKLKVDPDSSTEMGFPDMLSTIKAMAATETAGISFTASRIVCDEHIEHPYAIQNYLAAKPTIDAGGQFISVFTANEDKLDSLAVEIFKGAIAGTNGFTGLFFPYTVRPGRDDAWYKRTRDSVPEQELKGLSPDIYMARNYPRTIEEALSPPKTLAVFDKTVLDSMMGDVRNPLAMVRDSIDSKIVNIYQEPMIGGYYVAATDTSHGVGKDYNVTVVLNVKTGAVVADIYHNKLSPEELALHSVRLLALFHSPIWFPEDNDWGRVTITTAQTLGYKNLGYQDEKKKKIGWHTDEKTRNDLWGALIPAINNRQLVVFNKEGLKTFYDVIRNPDKQGRIEAMSSRHDDYPMALGIAWINRDKVSTGEWKPKVISSLHFGGAISPGVYGR